MKKTLENKTFETAKQKTERLSELRRHRYLAEKQIIGGVCYPVLSAFPTEENVGKHESVTDKLKYLVSGAKE